MVHRFRLSTLLLVVAMVALVLGALERSRRQRTMAFVKSWSVPNESVDSARALAREWMARREFSPISDRKPRTIPLGAATIDDRGLLQTEYFVRERGSGAPLYGGVTVRSNGISVAGPITDLRIELSLGVGAPWPWEVSSLRAEIEDFYQDFGQWIQATF